MNKQKKYTVCYKLHRANGKIRYYIFDYYHLYSKDSYIIKIDRDGTATRLRSSLTPHYIASFEGWKIYKNQFTIGQLMTKFPGIIDVQ